VEPNEITHQILREIRDAARDTNTRVDETNRRLDETNLRLDETNLRLDGTNLRLDRTREELGKRIVESEIRTATAITAVAGEIHQIKELLIDRLDLRDRVSACERDIAWLRARIGE